VIVGQSGCIRVSRSDESVFLRNQDLGLGTSKVKLLHLPRKCFEPSLVNVMVATRDGEKGQMLHNASSETLELESAVHALQVLQAVGFEHSWLKARDG